MEGFRGWSVSLYLASKTVKVYEVVFHSDNPAQAYAGAAGDGSFVQRFRKLGDAESFAKGKHYYGREASVREDSVPRRLAQRWGVA